MSSTLRIAVTGRADIAAPHLTTLVISNKTGPIQRLQKKARPAESAVLERPLALRRGAAVAPEFRHAACQNFLDTRDWPIIRALGNV